MPASHAAAFRLKALVESDAGALVRILQCFQARNVLPRRVSACRLGDQFLEAEIEVDPHDLCCDALRLIAAKIEQLPIVLAVVVCE